MLGSTLFVAALAASGGAVFGFLLSGFCVGAASADHADDQAEVLLENGILWSRALAAEGHLEALGRLPDLPAEASEILARALNR